LSSILRCSIIKTLSSSSSLWIFSLVGSFISLSSTSSNTGLLRRYPLHN
jgi:hypothetical protein